MAKHWKLVATAPQDGREIMFKRKPPFAASGNIIIGFWHIGQNIPGWKGHNGGTIIEEVWTHWRDLPDL